MLLLLVLLPHLPYGLTSSKRGGIRVETPVCEMSRELFYAWRVSSGKDGESSA